MFVLFPFVSRGNGTIVAMLLVGCGVWDADVRLQHAVQGSIRLAALSLNGNWEGDKQHRFDIEQAWPSLQLASLRVVGTSSQVTVCTLEGVSLPKAFTSSQNPITTRYVGTGTAAN